MTISSRNKLLWYLDILGALAMYLYVLTTYVAHDVIIKSYANSISLYTFLALVLFKTVLEIRKFPRTSRFTLWYLLFTIFSFIVMLYSPEVKLFDSTFYSIFVAFALIFSFELYLKSENSFKCLVWCYAISGFATVLLLFFTGNLEGNPSDRLGQDFFGNANDFASLMMIAAMCALWLTIYTRSARKILPFLFFLADMYALVLSGGRKYFVIPFVFLYFILLFKRDRKGRVHIFRVTLIFAVLFFAVLIAIMKIPFLYESIGVRMEGLIQAFLGTGGDNSSLVRADMRNAAIAEWKKAPLFGYGLDSFKYYALEHFEHFYYSHCNYTELLYSGGIFYFILYYFMFAKIAFEAFRRKALASPYRAFAIAVPVCLFILDFGAVSFYSPHNLIMLLLACKCLTFSNTDVLNEGVKPQHFAFLRKKNNLPDSAENV